MKHLLRLLTMAAVLICGGAYAEEEEAETKELARIPQILSQVELINKAKPNLDAKIYFVYQSRSTCGICVAEAPALVREYKRMKRQGCEMVMMNIDNNPEAAEKWVKKARMDFPVIHPSQSMSCGMPWNYTGKGLLPCMVAMTPDGTKLGEASGQEVANFVKTWKTLLRDIEQEERKAAAAEKKEKSKKADKKSSKKKDKKSKRGKKKRVDDDEDEETSED